MWGFESLTLRQVSMIIQRPQQIRTIPKDRNGDLICRNCNRDGWSHVPFAPYHCKNYEDERVLDTTFEAVCVFRPIVVPD